MCGHEMEVELDTFLFHHSGSDFATGIAEHLQPSSCHLRERVGRTDHHAAQTLAYQHG